MEEPFHKKDDFAEAVSVLADIVNRASRAKPTSAQDQFTCSVPLGLLMRAKMVLREISGSDYGNSSTRQASSREF